VNPSPKSARKTSTKVTQAVTGELALLTEIRQRAGAFETPQIIRGIGDDCALLRLKANEEFAVTTDFSIEGRHFRLEWHTPESVGHRTLARGLSDLAAMGAKPVAAFLSLALPKVLTSATKKNDKSWLDRFYDGLLALAAEEETPLAGGDLSESPIVVADIVLTGSVPRGKALLRSGARAGDRIFVTGALGGALLGLRVLEENEGRELTESERNNALHRHFYPQPRLAQGLALRRLASAAMDLSDGLSTDLARLCAESKVRAEIDAEHLPLAPGVTLDEALHGGDDYELLFTAPTKAKITAEIAGVRVTEIGRMLPLRAGRAAITLVDKKKRTPLEAKGWEHFA
jgi:thiamine-monophosphate kinase